MGNTIGLDIGGTKVLGVLLADDGTVLREERLASPHTGLEALVATGASIVDQLDAPGAPVGVGAAGLVDRQGVVRYAPNLPNVREAPLRDALAQATGHKVVVDNDAGCRHPRRGHLRRRDRPARRAARDARHRHRRRLPLRRPDVSGRAQLRRRDRALHRRSSTGRCARAANAAIGRRSRPVPRSAAWRAISSPTVAGAALVAAAGGDPAAVTGTHVGIAAAAGRPRRARSARAVLRERRARARRFDRTSSTPSASSSRAASSSSARCCSGRCGKRSVVTSKASTTGRAVDDRPRPARRARRCGRRRGTRA